MSEPREIIVQELPIRHRSVLADYGGGPSRRLSSSLEAARQSSFSQLVPQWVYYLVVMLGGGVILGAPALLIGLTHSPDEFWPVYLTTRFNPLLAETFRWSVLAAGTFTTYFFVLTLITLIPFMVNAGEACTEREMISTRAQDGLKRVMMIRHYFALPMAAFTMWLLVGLLIGGVSAKSNLVGSSRLSEFYLTRTAFALLLFSLVLLVEKLVVQKVAVNYHFDYYADRILENQFSLAALRRLRRKFPPTHNVAEVLAAKTSDELAREESVEIAKSIFNGLRSEGRDYLIPSDFECLLAADDAQRLFIILDGDTNGDLTLREMISGVQSVYSERELLSHALAANDELVMRLDALGLGLVTAMTAALCLPIFNVSLAASIFYLASTVMTAKIAFSGSMVSIFSTIIFIFVSHPFDVGDTVLINGHKYKVKSIGWWNSSFYGDGQRLVYIANETLDGSTICNLRRSGPQSVDIVLSVHLSTTQEQINRLEEGLNDFLLQNPRDFADTLRITVLEIVNEQNIKLKMTVPHKSNFQSSEVKNRRHLLFMECLRNSIAELGIYLAEENMQQ